MRALDQYRVFFSQHRPCQGVGNRVTVGVRRHELKATTPPDDGVIRPDEVHVMGFWEDCRGPTPRRRRRTWSVPTATAPLSPPRLTRTLCSLRGQSHCPSTVALGALYRRLPNRSATRIPCSASRMAFRIRCQAAKALRPESAEGTACRREKIVFSPGRRPCPVRTRLGSTLIVGKDPDTAVADQHQGALPEHLMKVTQP